MKATSVIQRLLLLVSVPLLALVISIGMQTRQSYVDYRNSEQTLQLMDLSVSAGNLIHTLQVERGSTAGFLQSKGQKFADVLPGIRKTTDERLAAFRQEIGRTDTAALPSLAKAITTVLGQLEELASIREKASQQTLAVADEVAYYTQVVASLVGAMSVGVEFSLDPTVSQKMIAYLSFVRAKENAGQERALITTAFTANKLEPEQYRTVLGKIHHQEAYFNDFNGIAGAEEKRVLAAVLGADAAKEVARMRTVLADKAVEGDFDVDPTAWFATITNKIDGLHEAETFIADRIKDEANARLHASRTTFFAVFALGALTLVLTLVISLGVARSIAFPLREMVAFAEHSIAERDFSGEAPEHGAAEVARTGAVFNNLIRKFRAIILDTRESSDQITRAAHALALSSQRVGDGSLVQSDAASSVATAVEQASVSVSETASNAKAAAEVVARARQDSEEALAVMRDMMSNMSEVARLIHDSGLKVEALNGSSQKIGSIVQVIKDIADQTNLLALNAAIEAARAGEQGRGFAVVADEVRKLAERTTLSTSEIASLLTSIQDGIGSTMAAMQLANAQSDASLKLVDRSGNAVQQIDRGSREVAENVQNISNALTEQDSAIRQIAVNVEQIAQMTESNNDAAADNSRTAAQLDSLSLQLREAVSVFKL